MANRATLNPFSNLIIKNRYTNHLRNDTLLARFINTWRVLLYWSVNEKDTENPHTKALGVLAIPLFFLVLVPGVITGAAVIVASILAMLAIPTVITIALTPVILAVHIGAKIYNACARLSNATPKVQSRVEPASELKTQLQKISDANKKDSQDNKAKPTSNENQQRNQAVDHDDQKDQVVEDKDDTDNDSVRDTKSGYIINQP